MVSPQLNSLWVVNPGLALYIRIINSGIIYYNHNHYMAVCQNLVPL